MAALARRGGVGGGGGDNSCGPVWLSSGRGEETRRDEQT
jgi:hypothetical protein